MALHCPGRNPVYRAARIFFDSQHQDEVPEAGHWLQVALDLVASTPNSSLWTFLSIVYAKESRDFLTEFRRRRSVPLAEWEMRGHWNPTWFDLRFPRITKCLVYSIERVINSDQYEAWNLHRITNFLTDEEKLLKEFVEFLFVLDRQILTVQT